VLFALALLAMTSCQSAPPKKAKPQRLQTQLVGQSYPSSKDFEVQVELKARSPRQFDLTYVFSRPLKSFQFEQDWNAYRARTWKPLTPGAHWTQGPANAERIEFDQPSTQVTFQISPYTGRMQAYYDPFLEFSNGSMGVHLKQFAVKPQLERPLNTNYRMIITGSKLGQKYVVIDGQRLKLPVEVSSLLNNSGQDAYLFFGDGHVRREGSLELLMDEGLPQWLSSSIRRELVAANAHYAQHLGGRPRAKAYFMINWVKSSPTLGVGGSVLENTEARTVVLTVRGPRLDAEDPQFTRRVRSTIFHELAHFWNISDDEDFRPNGWIIEGGAEAITYRSLRDLNLITPLDYDATIKKFIQDCADQYKAPMVLSRLKAEESYQPAYTCGFVASLITEKLLTKPADFYEFQRALFEQRDRQKGRYGIKDYFEVLARMTRDQARAAILREWIEAPPEDRKTLMESLLKREAL
jgi:hypothetical protein